MRHSAEWQRGDTAQRKFGEIIQRSGRCVLPTYAFEDVTPETKAPVMLAANGEILVTPDLLVVGKEYARWMEVKSKSVPTWYRRLSRWEHGCDRHLFDEYQRVQEESGIQVRIIVQELSSPTAEDMESTLVLTGSWMWIALDTARRHGDAREDWPGGRSQPNRRGRNGRGGWLWPRTCMKPVQEKTA